ncbi:hypothetical protein [Mesorhizobium sp. M0847]|uniref:hypothetical protein n=1 Tax=unclassified Mesorhizobium TaxID=325217 RepID=UPI003339982C
MTQALSLMAASVFHVLDLTHESDGSPGENERLKTLLAQTQAALAEHQAALAEAEEARRRLDV